MAQLRHTLTDFGTRRRQRLTWFVSIFAGLIILIALLGFLVAPWVVKSFVADKIGAEIGRKLEFGAVQINPFALSAKLSQVALYEADRQHKMLTIGEVYLNTSSASLVRLAPVISEIRIQQPMVHLVRVSENRFNFSDIVDKILAKPDTGASHFSLNNIHLRGGQIDYDDQVRKSHHSLSEIDLAIPFLSNLKRRVDIFTQPAFSAKLDGSPFAISGKTRPFATNRDTTLRIDLDALSLPEFIALVPVALNFKLKSGLLDTRLKFDFHENAGTGSVIVSGTAAVREMQLQDQAGAPLLEWKTLSLDLARVEPLNRLVRINALKLDAPQLHATRAKDGSVNLLRAFALPTMAASAASHNPAATPKPKKTKPLAFALTRADIRNAQVYWQDAGANDVTLHVKQLDANLSNFNTDGSQPALLHATLETDHNETLRYDGTLAADGKALRGEAQLIAWQPQRLRAYFKSLFAGDLGNSLLDATLPYQLAWPANGLNASLTNASARLRNLKITLPGEKEAAASAREIALDGLQFDLNKHSVSAAQLTVDAAKIAIKRDAKGSIDLLTVLVGTPPHQTKAKPDKPAEPAKAAAAQWQTALQHLKIEQSEIRFSDAQVAAQNNGKPALQQLSKLNLSVDNLNWHSGTGAQHSTPLPVALSVSHNQRGSLTAKGTLNLQPLAANLQIDAKQLDLTAFQPYFAERSNASISNGALNASGKLTLQLPEQAAPRVSYTGALNLTGVRTRDRLSGDDFVRWKSLTVANIAAHLNTEKNPLVLSLGKVALSDFYARIIVNPNGRLNLQDIVAHAEQGQATPTVSLTQSNVTTAASAPPVAAKSGPDPLIQISQIDLQGGNINFSDNFVKPNYTANLTGMSGKISKLASNQQTPADLALQGKLDNDSPVEINGKLNPLGPQLFLDLVASAHGVELTRLTPYSTKYAGYPITKGKLSVDVTYHIENGKLTAQNKLFLDQLTFGDKVDSPSATKLPVLLAVALLSNSRGEIDINLPISGSLSDPEFSVGGVILKVIVNLLTKAITAPFSLLSSAFGGGDEASYIVFEPGSSSLTAAANKKLEILAKALNDRPTLKLDITGRVDPDTDRDGARHAYVDRKIRLQKAEDMRAQGATAQLSEISIKPDEYTKYLTRAYKAEKFSKPRNLIGLNKSLPAAEMEKLMLDHAPAGDDELKALADRRALVVKQTLEQSGKVPNERMFLTASKLNAASIKDNGKPNRVEFSMKQ